MESNTRGAGDLRRDAALLPCHSPVFQPIPSIPQMTPLKLITGYPRLAAADRPPVYNRHQPIPSIPECDMRRFALATLVLLFVTTAFAEDANPIKVLIITGDEYHKWKETAPFLAKVLKKAGMRADVTEAPSKDLTTENLAKYDVLLLNYRNTPQGAKANPASVWSDENKKAVLKAVKGGKGLYVYHWASSAFTGDSDFEREYERAIAGGWRKQGNHGKMHQFTVTVRKKHPITEGIKEFVHGRDELYQNSVLPKGSEVLATAYSDREKDPKNTGKHEPVVWVAKYGKGRVVNNVLGHDTAAMQGKGFQTLLIRGVEWAATGKATTAAPAELKRAK
jgi:type 1 glutamine amidotransferase